MPLVFRVDLWLSDCFVRAIIYGYVKYCKQRPAKAIMSMSGFVGLYRIEEEKKRQHFLTDFYWYVMEELRRSVATAFLFSRGVIVNRIRGHASDGSRASSNVLVIENERNVDLFLSMNSSKTPE